MLTTLLAPRQWLRGLQSGRSWTWQAPGWQKFPVLDCPFHDPQIAITSCCKVEDFNSCVKSVKSVKSPFSCFRLLICLYMFLFRSVCGCWCVHHRSESMPLFAWFCLYRYKVCLDSEAYDFRGRGAANPQFWSLQCWFLKWGGSKPNHWHPWAS